MWSHDRTLPPAATFEPERWSKSWKAGEEDKAVYSHIPKPKGFVEQMGQAFKEMVPKKKIGRVKEWGSREWKPLRKGEAVSSSSLTDIDGRMSGGEPPKSTWKRKPHKTLTSGVDASDWTKK